MSARFRYSSACDAALHRCERSPTALMRKASSSMLQSPTDANVSSEMCVQRMRMSNGRDIASAAMILGAGKSAAVSRALVLFPGVHHETAVGAVSSAGLHAGPVLAPSAAGVRTQSRGRAMLGWGVPLAAWRAARMSLYGSSQRLRVEACLINHSASASSTDIQPPARWIVSADTRLLLLRSTRGAANSYRFLMRRPAATSRGMARMRRILLLRLGRRQPEKPRKTRGLTGQLAQADAARSAAGGERQLPRRWPKSSALRTP